MVVLLGFMDVYGGTTNLRLGSTTVKPDTDSDFLSEKHLRVGSYMLIIPTK